jgi:hypothetical protein
MIHAGLSSAPPGLAGACSSGGDLRKVDSETTQGTSTRDYFDDEYDEAFGRNRVEHARGGLLACFRLRLDTKGFTNRCPGE